MKLVAVGESLFRLQGLTATAMKTARGLLFAVYCAISIALPLLTYPTFAQQPQGANSKAARASVTGKIAVANGEGVTSPFVGITVKLAGPSAGPIPQSMVSDAEVR